jgi:hypothetical protein
MPIMSVTQEAEKEGSNLEASQGKSRRPYLRNKLKPKRTACVVQEAECLPCKCEALTSIPSTTNNK